MYVFMNVRTTRLCCCVDHASGRDRPLRSPGTDALAVVTPVTAPLCLVTRMRCGQETNAAIARYRDACAGVCHGHRRSLLLLAYRCFWDTPIAQSRGTFTTDILLE
jgi:hypothetical protein